MDTTGKEFVSFWATARIKGLMNPNTATSFSAATRKVMSALDDWENRDVRQLDPDEVLTRFRNLYGRDYTPASLGAYERRFKLALQSFVDHVDNPTKWKAPGQTAAARKGKGEKPARANKTKGNAKPKASDDGFLDHDGGGTGPASVQLLEYPFRLRLNCIVRLRLPDDLTMAEVQRLTAYMKTMTVDYAPSES